MRRRKRHLTQAAQRAQVARHEGNLRPPDALGAQLSPEFLVSRSLHGLAGPGNGSVVRARAFSL
jgi:hypothetical protein